LIGGGLVAKDPNRKWAKTRKVAHASSRHPREDFPPEIISEEDLRREYRKLMEKKRKQRRGD